MTNVKEITHFQKNKIQKIIDNTLSKQISPHNSPHRFSKVSYQIKKQLMQNTLYKEGKSKLNTNQNIQSYQSTKSIKGNLKVNVNTQMFDPTVKYFQSQHKSKLNILREAQVLSSKQKKMLNMYKSQQNIKNKNISLLKPKLSFKRNQGKNKQMSLLSSFSSKKLEVLPLENAYIKQSNLDDQTFQKPGKYESQSTKQTPFQQKKILKVFKIFQQTQKFIPSFNQTAKQRQPLNLKFRIKPKIKSQSFQVNPATIHQTSQMFYSSNIEQYKEEQKSPLINTSTLMKTKGVQLKKDEQKMKRQIKTFYNLMRQKKSSTEMKVFRPQDGIFKYQRRNIHSQKQKNRQIGKINQYKKIKKQLLSPHIKKQQKPRIIRQPFSLTSILAYQALQPYLQSMSMHVNYVDRQGVFSNKKKLSQNYKGNYSQKKFSSKADSFRNMINIQQKNTKFMNQTKKGEYETKIADKQKISGWQMNDLMYSQEVQM